MDRKTTGGIVLSKKALTVLILAVILLVAGGVYAGMNWNKWFGNGNAVADGTASESGTSEGYNPDVDPNASDWDGTLSNASDSDSEDSVGILLRAIRPMPASTAIR